jgi:CBS domain containing-hemolysin-like protein
MSILVGLTAVLLLLVVNAFFVAAEFSLVAVDRARVEAAAGTDPAARRVRALTRRLTSHLSGAQFGITLSALLLGFVAEPTAARIITGGEHPTGLSVVIAIAAAALLHMVLGEQVPKYVALAAPEAVSRRLAPLVLAYGVVVRPVVVVLNGSANAVLRWVGVEPREELGSSRTLDELGDLVRESSDVTLDSSDVELFTRSIRFSEKMVADVLVPRLEVEALRLDATGADLLERSARTGHSRFPVFESDLDHVVGVVHVKSLLRRPAALRGHAPVVELMHDVLAVPETRFLDDLLADLREHRGHMAVVVDEHGGTAGIVTVEDALEEIVGEIDDEHDTRVVRTRLDGPGRNVVSGRLNLDEVADITGLRLPPGPYETLAGFVLQRLGRLPQPTAMVEHEGWKIEVVAVEGRRIATLRIVVPPDGGDST